MHGVLLLKKPYFESFVRDVCRYCDKLGRTLQPHFTLNVAYAHSDVGVRI